MSTSQRLYLGNLDLDIKEDSIRGLFEENGLKTTNIFVKKGYAFVDCPDQFTAETAINKLNGYSLKGNAIHVEPSTSQKRKTNTVIVRGIPAAMSRGEIERLLSTYGTIQKLDQISKLGATCQVQCTFETPDQAENCVGQVNNVEYQGSSLKCHYFNPRNRGVTKLRNVNFPLRMLVPVDVVGAIIGRKGEQIREITQESKARIDVRRKDSAVTGEKLITVSGAPEHCSSACRAILIVVERESENKERELVLKVLAHNNLCGRLIGRGGASIKHIMEESGARVSVSRYLYMHDLSGYSMERAVVVRGSMDEMSAAEKLISAKLRVCFENDMQAMGQRGGMGMVPGLMMAPYGMPPPNRMPFGTGFPPLGGGYSGTSHPTPAALNNNLMSLSETAFMLVPNASVGAIIGSRGSNIRSIIRASGAQIKIESLGPEENSKTVRERSVTITGSPEAQWKAQFYLFDKVKSVSYSGPLEPELPVEIPVPSDMVGRIIGKSGLTIREIQRTTGSLIKFPERSKTPELGEVRVQIRGHFFSSQSAQRRIHSLIDQTMSPPRPASNPGKSVSPPPPPPQQQASGTVLVAQPVVVPAIPQIYVSS